MWFAAIVTRAAAQEAEAASGPRLDTGDTAWMLTSTALVLLMTIPGLALFYGGLVRPKNVLSTLMHSFFCAALISVTWVVYGYSLAFGPTVGGIVGSLDHALFRGVLGTTSAVAPTIPQSLFAVFQATFAIITPALISGTFAERMRFPAFALYMLLWSTLIYAPLAHWVWGGGWIATRVGALDFAGGTVVHISSGVSALVTAAYLGRRLGYSPGEAMPPHNLPLTVVGASLLWVGWFGFNAGSAVSSSELAATAFVNTNTAAAAAALGWMLTEWMRMGRPTILGAATGAVAGLVCITPAAGFVTPAASIIFGFAAGFVCFIAVSLKARFGYDDALDVVGVHMVGGTLGALLTGVFATSAVNSAIPTLSGGLEGGLLYGYPEMVGKQAIAIAATYGLCGFGTLVILAVVNAIAQIRPEPEDEMLGLDLSQHSEQGYPHFQVVLGLGAVERKSLERELEETERRKERILQLMRSAESGSPFSATWTAERTPPRQVEQHPPVSSFRTPPTTSPLSPPPPPPPPAARPSTPAATGGTMRLYVENVDRKWLRAVWEDLCQQYPLNVPPDFKDIYDHVVSFRDNVFTLRGGDPRQYRSKIANLLHLYGAENPEVRVE
jgi:Amt family ammonium transporter